MDINERKERVDLALAILKRTLIETETSMAIQGNRLVFFGTADYLETGAVGRCPRFSVSIDNLVK